MSSVLISNLNGLYKQVYAETLETLLPNVAIIFNRLKWNDKAITGDYYNMPVKLARSTGVTKASRGDGAFAINAGRPLQSKNAQIQGSQILIEDSIAYETAANAVGKGEAAFYDATKLVLEGMRESMSTFLELDILYGSVGLGKCASSANAGATSTVITIKTSEWAEGIWAGMEGIGLNFYNAASLISSGADAVFTLTSVSDTGRTLTVSGTATGITALDAAILANANIIDVYVNGGYGKEMSGLFKQFQNTGTLFGISASTYNLWKSNSYSVSGILTYADVARAAGRPCARGGLKSAASLYVNHKTWADLNASQAAARIQDSSYSPKTGEEGVQAIKYNAQNGVIEVISHSAMKEGYALFFSETDVFMGGSRKPGFMTPGKEGEELFYQLAGNAGYGIRNYTDAFVLAEKPARTAVISGIVNT